MAHFAKIENGSVTQVIVINNDVLLDENGIEQELIGIDFCKSLYGETTEWVQTSYNGNTRDKYAAPGDIYDSILDKFITPESPKNSD